MWSNTNEEIKHSWKKSLEKDFEIINPEYKSLCPACIQMRMKEIIILENGKCKIFT